MTATDERLGQAELDIPKAEADDLTLWSVTTLLKVIASEGLIYWAAGETASAALDDQDVWQAMLRRGRGEAWKWLRDARFRPQRERLSAADLGTAFHGLAESYGLTGVRPDKNAIADAIRGRSRDADVRAEGPVLSAMLDQFDRWLQKAQPVYQATEVVTYSPTWGYAGTCDGFMTIDGYRVIFDYKTHREHLDGQGKPRTPYPEQNALQLAAYRYAEFAAVWRPRMTEVFRRRYYVLNDTERAMAVPVPECDGGIVIQVTPESCDAFPMRVDEQVHRAFLHCIELSRWVNEESKTVMRDPLVFEVDT